MSGRIYELKQRGMSIEKHMVRRGEKKIASYFASRAS